ncbi:hypothetical protein [Saccharothrix sp. NRRL B-16348]|uniref:hypothetical protein n=1 Tax=Saccharothrix sp. NRRL B-16348 TaxID=1415542 RepID=UPI0012FC0407|nr:hypothetical protein [Saccharothrix sp. NRRL B-16348]
MAGVGVAPAQVGPQGASPEGVVAVVGVGDAELPPVARSGPQDCLSGVFVINQAWLLDHHHGRTEGVNTKTS